MPNKQIFQLIEEKIKTNQEDELVHLLTTHKIGVNTPFGDHQETCLHLAAKAGQAGITRRLLDMGAAPDIRDVYGITPLYRALFIETPHIDVIEVLLARGANPDLEQTVKSCYGGYDILNPLLQAADNLALTTLLLQHGASPWKADERANQLVNDVKTALLKLKGAIQDGDIKAVSDVLTECPFNIINHYLEPGRNITALSEAARFRQWDIVRLLLKQGANPNVQGSTLLNQASSAGLIDVVECLLDSKVNIDTKDSDGFTPLACAILSRHPAIATLLLVRGANINLLNGSPILSVIRGMGYDYVHKYHNREDDGYGDTPEIEEPLDGESEDSKLAMITTLLENGINPWCETINVKTGQLVSPSELCAEGSRLGSLLNAVEGSLLELKHAVETNNVVKAEKIISTIRIAIVNTPLQKNGQTALHMARTKEMIECLARHGARANIRDTHGRTVLHRMALANEPDVVEQLARLWPESVHQLNDAGQTPLHIAVISGHRHIVRILLEHGANPQTTDKNGKTSLRLAEKHGQRKIVDLLMARNTIPGAKDKKGPSPERLFDNTTSGQERYTPVKLLQDDWIKMEDALIKAISWLDARENASPAASSSSSNPPQEPPIGTGVAVAGFFGERPSYVKRQLMDRLASTSTTYVIEP